MHPFNNDNIASVLVNPCLIYIRVIMVNFSTYARRCVYYLVDACKSDKHRFPSRSFYKVSPEMDENSEELHDFFYGIDSSPTVPCTMKHRGESKPTFT